MQNHEFTVNNRITFNHNHIHKIFGFLIFLISLIVYTITVQPTAGLWDSGEFIATSNLLQITHPPGAPLYTIIGRLFVMLPFGQEPAFMINWASSLFSALTVLFLFLVSVRLIESYKGKIYKDIFDTIITYTACSIGSLSLAFSYTFWFNATEAEVYPLALFLSALVIWLALVWSDNSDNEGSEKYLLLIAYFTGLSLGVHLYGVLVIVPVVMIVIFKKYPADNKILIESVKFFFIHVIILIIVGALIWVGIDGKIPPSENELSQTTYNFLFWGSLVSAVYLFILRKKLLIKNSIYFILLIGVLLMGVVYPGVSILLKLTAALSGNSTTAAILLIIISLFVILYLVRRSDNEQNFTSSLLLKSLLFVLIGFSTYSLVPIRSNQDTPINFNTPQTINELHSYIGRESYRGFPIFKRRWSMENQYMETYLNYDNDLEFMVKYQVNHMFHRYLLWNYAGKSNELENDGFDFKVLFGIPFLIGLFGLFYHFRKDWKMAMAMFFVFLFFGYLMNYYANFQQPQLRERDYFFVGAFFVFSFWISAGIRGLADLILSIKADAIKKPAVAGMLLICLFFVPINMFKVNYAEHDRSQNYAARDFAYNLLQSVDKNAILFTQGDSDTFPIWYLQDVEGIRRDVTAVNLGIIEMPWYIKQLKNSARCKSSPIKMTLSDKQIDNLAPIMWERQKVSLRVNEKVINKFGVTDTSVINNKKIEWEIKPTAKIDNKTYLLPADLVLKNIIETNAWERPVYFALTCPDKSKQGLENNLRLDGLAFQLVPNNLHFTGDYPIDSAIITAHLFPELSEQRVDEGKGFLFRGLNNPEIYFDSDITKLLQFNRSPFLALACNCIRNENNTEEGLKVLTAMEEIIPRSNIPMGYWQKHYFADLYYSAGEMKKYNEVAKEIEITSLHQIEKNPYDFERMQNPYQTLFVIYNKQQKYKKAYNLALRLKSLVPYNATAIKLVEEYKALLKAGNNDTNTVEGN